MLDQLSGFVALHVSSGSEVSGNGAEPGPVGNVPATAIRCVCSGSFLCFGIDDGDDDNVDGDGGFSRCCKDARSEER